MEETTVLPPFTVTSRAIEAIEAVGGCVRLDLESGGCCGSFYSFSLSSPDEVADGDSVYGCPGALLVVSREADAVMVGAHLDHGAKLKPPRFRVTRNPNTAEVCACRRSFGEPWPGPGQSGCRSYQPMPWDGTYEPPEEWQRRTGWTRPTC